MYRPDLWKLVSYAVCMCYMVKEGLRWWVKLDADRALGSLDEEPRVRPEKIWVLRQGRVGP